MTDPDPQSPHALPPGQRLTPKFPVLHYGPVPRFKPDSWRLTVNGATADGQEHHLDVEAFEALDRATITADMHCVTKWTALDNTWGGVLADTVMALVPPAPQVTHVMAWAEYGYSANLRLKDFADPSVILATHHNGELLTPERGYPLRLIVPRLYAWKGPKWLRGIEYLTTARRGFWEERGYHTLGDPWTEQRYSYQE